MKTPKFEELVYSDPIEDILTQQTVDEIDSYYDDSEYDDNSFSALLDSSNDF